MGLQVLALERNYELTIGANIGTTITALLASLTQTGLHFRQSVQIALTHFFFNLTGCLLWYVLPCLRRIPIYLSRHIGRIVSEYRWFAFVYITFVFFLCPLIILLLALIHWLAAVLFLSIVFLLLLFILFIRYYQNNTPHRLPAILRSWAFLPRACRSFSYWDHRFEILTKRICCSRCIHLLYPTNQMPLKEQYISMKDQYLTALDHRFLSHTHQLTHLFEKYHAPVISLYESRHPLANYVEDLYCSLTGKPTQGQKALSTLRQVNFHEKEEDEFIDRVFVFDREKKKDLLSKEQNSMLSF